MTDHVFRCEDALVPPKWKTIAVQHALGGSGEDPTPVDFRLEIPSQLVGTLPDRPIDLVRIAAYIYFADQSVSRGGERDVYGRRWRRRMLMAIGVSDPDFWRSEQVSQALSQALAFLTEDEWQFHFSPRRQSAPFQLQLIPSDSSLHGDPGCVVLFSGGADSLAACLAAHLQKAKPFLVSHRPSNLAAGNHKRLIKELRNRVSSTGFRQTSAIIHRRGSDASDYSQRSRSFLFASLGATIANSLRVGEVHLADNGFVSINLPVSDQVVGAQASRTTHPKFLRLFNDLARVIFDGTVEVRNPLGNLTRAEAVHSLQEAGVPELLEETRSCVHPRGRTTYAPHCGACSQCVDRRFGYLAADMEEYDRANAYEVDIFRDELGEGEPRVIATSYVRLALHLERLAEDEFFLEFPQLYECITDQHSEKQARELIEMLKRHAQEVLAVMRGQVARHADDIVRGTLPATCLVRLVPTGGAPTQEPTPHPKNFDHSPDFATVRYKGKEYSLGPTERAAFRILYEAWKQGMPELAGDYVLEQAESDARSISELFRRSGVWNTLVVPGSRRGLYRLNLD